MIEKNRQGIHFFEFREFSKNKDIRHFISSRVGGVSNPPFDGLNLGMHVGDHLPNVVKNRGLLARALDSDLDLFTFANQTHSANVSVVEENHRGCGASELGTAIPDTDAMITQAKNIWLCVQIADCVPLLLYDPARQVIAAVHAGWKGIVKQIVQATVKKMVTQFGSKPEKILAGLGPANGPCCYEIGEEVKQQIVTLDELNQGTISPGNKPGKYFFDQWKAVSMQLVDAGLDPNNIEHSELCTQCLNKTFFSSRADRGTTGRFAACIMLVPV
ncbi:MAG TPA: peptidoglycan editing factor PgeF [Bacteroidales bacterium]|nr:peptidoglycan editing factor PgeF [Bacteroidales bacterium]